MLSKGKPRPPFLTTDALHSSFRYCQSLPLFHVLPSIPSMLLSARETILQLFLCLACATLHLAYVHLYCPPSLGVRGATIATCLPFQNWLKQSHSSTTRSKTGHRHLGTLRSPSAADAEV